jgi:hypothetical protein
VVTDHSQIGLLYLLDKHDNQLYKMPTESLNIVQGNSQVNISKEVLEPTQIYLPNDYTSLKIHQNKVHYIVPTDDINLFPNSYDLHIQSLLGKNKESANEVFKLNCNCGYDVANSGLMISERMSFEGDIHRTISK